MKLVLYQYWCWGCELWFGEPDTPMEPSKLCPTCKEHRLRCCDSSRYPED